jgi:hypothetical protein
MSTIERTQCDDSIPYRQLKSVPSGTTWDGLSGFSFSSDGTAFSSALSEVSMIWYDSEDAVALTLTETDGITISSASEWEFDIESRLISLAAGSYYWKLKTTDASGIVKIRLQGTIDIT